MTSRLPILAVLVGMVVGGCAKVNAQNSVAGPPRFIPEDVGCKAQLRWYCTEAHWECEKGFVLDGAKITWPDGVARIEPERCKAEAK